MLDIRKSDQNKTRATIKNFKNAFVCLNANKAKQET